MMGEYPSDYAEGGTLWSHPCRTRGVEEELSLEKEKKNYLIFYCVRAVGSLAGTLSSLW